MPLLLKWNSSSLIMSGYVQSLQVRPLRTASYCTLPLSPEVDDQKLYRLWSITYTAVFNLTGNPAVVLPVARSSGLPSIARAGRHATLEHSREARRSNWLFPASTRVLKPQVQT